MNLLENIYRKPTDKHTGAKEGEAYYLAKARELYHDFASPQGAVHFAYLANGPSRRSVKDLRDYGRGLQRIDKYLTEIGYSKEEAQKLGKDNISYSPAPVWQKYRNITKSKISDLSLAPRAIAIGGGAALERLVTRNRAKILRQPQTQMAAPQGSLPKDSLPASTPEEVDKLAELGGVLLDVEVMAKDALDLTLERSGWATLKAMIAEDLIDLGGFALDQSPRNGAITLDYVDFAQVIARQSIFPDFRDSDVRGYVRQRKATEILQIDPLKAALNWERLTQHHFSNYSSFTNDGRREDYSRPAHWLAKHGDFGVTEVKLYWTELEMEYYVVGKHSKGSRQFEKVGEGFQLSERGRRAGKKVESFSMLRMHKATMVLGTDIVYDYGRVDDLVAPGEAGAKGLAWPLQIYAAQEPSLTEKVIPAIDEYNIALFKMRDMMAKLPPAPRMVIDKSKIRDGVQLGQETYGIKDLLRLYQRDGLMILETNDEYSLPGEGGGGRVSPFEFVQSGVAEDFGILQASMSDAVQRIRDVTGINEVLDGSSPRGDMLKSVAEAMRLAGNNALRPWLEAYSEMFRSTCSSLVASYIRAVGEGGPMLASLPVDNGTVRLLKIGEDLLKYDLVIKVEASDTEYREYLMTVLAERREALPLEGYFQILSSIHQGDLQKAQYLLTIMTKKAEEAAQQRQIELAEANAAASAQAAQTAEQAKQSTEMAKAQGKAQVLELEYKLKEGQAQSDHVREMERIRLQKELEKESAVAVTTVNNANRLNQ